MQPELNELCSLNYRYADLCHCGDTWALHRPLNKPEQMQTYQDIAALAQSLLEPIIKHFAKPTLTYGFAGPELLKLIRRNTPPRIAPHLDQHAASELNQKQQLICKRQGAAVDLFVPGVDSFLLAEWIARCLPFDRMYLYERHRPIHLSVHEAPQRSIVWLRPVSEQNKRVPLRLNMLQMADLAEKR